MKSPQCTDQKENPALPENMEEVRVESVPSFWKTDPPTLKIQSLSEFLEENFNPARFKSEKAADRRIANLTKEWKNKRPILFRSLTSGGS